MFACFSFVPSDSVASVFLGSITEEKEEALGLPFDKSKKFGCDTIYNDLNITHSPIVKIDIYVTKSIYGRKFYCTVQKRPIKGRSQRV